MAKIRKIQEVHISMLQILLTKAHFSSRRRYREESVPRDLLCAGGMQHTDKVGILPGEQIKFGKDKSGTSSTNFTASGNTTSGSPL